jgi:hypothetical protein
VRKSFQTVSPRTPLNKAKKKGQDSREIAAAQPRLTGPSTSGLCLHIQVGELSEA